MEQDQTTVIKPNTAIFKSLTEATSCIELFFNGTEYKFKRDELPINIGRDSAQCEIIAASTTASRLHCSIEVVNHQIGIRDRSSNGTYIKIGRAETVLINNNFYPLASQGQLSLGEPGNTDSDQTIHFRVSADREKTAKK